MTTVRYLFAVAVAWPLVALAALMLAGPRWKRCNACHPGTDAWFDRQFERLAREVEA